MTTDTGGAGRWRGQPGTQNVKQVLEPTLGDGLDGVAASSAARPPRRRRRRRLREPLPGRHARRARDRPAPRPRQLPAGAVIAYQYGGGAGFGSRSLRDPAAVKEDVLDEYVSPAAARERYGVVLTGHAWTTERSRSTRARRAALRERLAKRARIARAMSWRVGDRHRRAPSPTSRCRRATTLVLDKTSRRPPTARSAVMDGPREARGARGHRARRLPRAARRDRPRHDRRPTTR